MFTFLDKGIKVKTMRLNIISQVKKIQFYKRIFRCLNVLIFLLLVTSFILLVKFHDKNQIILFVIFIPSICLVLVILNWILYLKILKQRNKLYEMRDELLK